MTVQNKNTFNSIQPKLERNMLYYRSYTKNCIFNYFQPRESVTRNQLNKIVILFYITDNQPAIKEVQKDVPYKKGITKMVSIEKIAKCTSAQLSVQLHYPFSTDSQTGIILANFEQLEQLFGLLTLVT